MLLRLMLGAIVALTATSAFASPPASCAHKFIGTWVYPGGTTVVAPGGLAYPKCPMCVPTQTWTCNGNVYLFSNSGPPGQFSATLTPDGTMAIGSTGIVATRVGAPKPTAPTVRTPKVNTPNVAATTPDIGTPPAPKVRTPKPNPPTARTPGVTTPQPTAPTVGTPTVNTPTVSVTAPNPAGPTAPKAQTPNTNGPTAGTPKPPTVTTPTVQ